MMKISVALLAYAVTALFLPSLVYGDWNLMGFFLISGLVAVVLSVFFAWIAARREGF